MPLSDGLETPVPTVPVFTRTAAFYDELYERRDSFPTRFARLDATLQRTRQTGGGRLLDVACGTGLYLPHLRERYDVEGIDRSPAMLAIARERAPDIPLHEGDMVEFDLGRRFDAVVCLGSSIGYARTIPRLRRALATFARHTAPGGVVIVEPWLTPDVWTPGHLTADFVDEPELKVARMSAGVPAEGRISVLDYHYLVASPRGVERFTERHEMGLFTVAETLDAFRDAGLVADHDPIGLSGRGLYVGTTRRQSDLAAFAAEARGR